jgi:tetratricopeptide (TPR) repeat protein
VDCNEAIKRGRTFMREHHIDMLSDIRVDTIHSGLESIEGWPMKATEGERPDGMEKALAFLRQNILYKRIDYKIKASSNAANILACMLNDLVVYYNEHDMPLAGLAEKEEIVLLLEKTNAEAFSATTLNQLADAYQMLAQHYQLINKEDRALECYQKAFEQLRNADVQIGGVESRIKLCKGLLAYAVCLYSQNKKNKSNTVCFTMLDLFEEIINQPCSNSDTEDKLDLMDACALLLGSLFEFEAQKQCLEFAVTYALELGKSTAAADYREELNSGLFKLFR